MSTEDLLPHLPFLRRHARLLTGATAIGDEYVRLCLELIAEEPQRLNGSDIRQTLFKAFHDSWSLLNPEPDAKSAGLTREDRLEAGLTKLGSMERRVLLLVAVEEFSREEAGSILGLSVADVRNLLVKGQQDLRRNVDVPVLIIEDEATIAMELEHIVSDMGLSVAGLATGQDAAVEKADQNQPGLVLADIQLTDDGNGIVAARDILEKYMVPIVFVTGFPERLLTGDADEPAFVVAKPFNAQGLKMTISQALDIYAEEKSAADHRSKLLSKLKRVTGKDIGMRAAEQMDHRPSA